MLMYLLPLKAFLPLPLRNQIQRNLVQMRWMTKWERSAALRCGEFALRRQKATPLHCRHWQMFGGKTLKISLGALETKFGQWFFFKHDKIIACIFNITLHKTQNHNRPNVLCKNQYIVCGSCFCTKQQNILPVLVMNREYFPYSAAILCTKINQY